MTPAELSRTVLRSVRGAVEARELVLAESAVPERVDVAPPPHAGCGDYATNVALRLAKHAGAPPREVAAVVAKRLAGVPGIAAVDVAGPGFLNITLGDDAPAALVREILAAGADYGRVDGLGGGGTVGSADGPAAVGARPVPSADGPAAAGARTTPPASSSGCAGARPAPPGDGPAAAGAGSAPVADGPASGSSGCAGARSAPPGDGPAAVGAGSAPVADGPVSAGVRPVPSADGPVSTGARPAAPAIDLRPAPGPRAAVVADALRAIMEAAGEGTRPGGEDVRPVPVKGPDGSYVTTEDLLARLGRDEMRWVLLRPAAHDHVRVPERPVQREGNPRFLVQYAYARTCAVLRNARELGVLTAGADEAATGRTSADATALHRASADAVAPDRNAVRQAAAGHVAASHVVAGQASAEQAAAGQTSADQAVAGHAADPTAAAPDRAVAAPPPVDHPDTTHPTADDPAAPHSRDSRVPHTPLHAALAAYPGVVGDAARLRAPERVVRQLEVIADAFFRFLVTCPPLPAGEQKPMAVHRARLAVAQAAGTVLANGLTLLGISAPEHL